MDSTQRHPVILVLGAGATLGGGFRTDVNDTLFQTPLDRSFFETPAVQLVFNPDAFPALSHYQRDPSLERTWATVDLYHKLCRTGIISEEAAAQELEEALRERARSDEAYRMKMEREDRGWRVPSMAGWELLMLTSAVFGGVAPFGNQQPLRQTVRRLMDEGLLLGVVTFNYDLSLEGVLGDQFFYPVLPDQDSTGRLHLFKLHGSLNWQTDSRSTPPITVVDPPTGVAEMDHGNSWYSQPEVVGPTFFKQEITFDVQNDFRAEFYRRVWSNAWDKLRSATAVVFVGFSFPATDFHAAALFRTAHLSGVGFRHVILCHHHDPALRGTAEHMLTGRTTQFTEFGEGLGDMAGRLDEVVAVLQT